MRSAVILPIALLAACSTLAPEPRTPQPIERAVTAFEPAADDVQSLLLAARTASAEQGNTYRLQAAERLARNGQRITSLLEEININAASQQQLRRYLMLRAQDALNGTDPAMALRWLGDSRLTQILLARSAQVELGLLKAATYAAMRSYLASARERIYIHSLLTLDDQVENTEAIFRTLQELPAKALRRSAERELTAEVRGWLSLAELAQRHADDPQRTLLELDRWRLAWASHPAASSPPKSLVMLREAIARQPTRIALLLPLHGDLAPYGRAVRDGIVGTSCGSSDSVIACLRV